MDDFERKLKRLQLAEPSQGLKARIFDQEPRGLRVYDLFRVRVPLAWAALFALFMGLAGMYLSDFLRDSALEQQGQVKQIYIIQSPSGRNPFDFSEPVGDFMPGELTVSTQAPEEI
ncbi:MAG: hypothetical protein ACYTBP_04700 [Planctomycetota bacterium]|jgi:hypothetical protein